MNLTTTVMMLLVLFLLCSGLFQFTFASHRLRFFELEDKEQCRDAQDECTADGGSLVTLYDEEDATFMQKYAETLGYSNVWLGLTKNRKKVSTWSNGDPYIFNHSSVNIANITNGSQICEAMVKNTWKGFSCSDEYYFMCYKENGSILIEKNKTWCQAEQYCREKYNSSLVSISNKDENLEVIEEGKNETFWIGLMHDEWEWVDQTCSTYRTWSDSSDVEGTETCTVWPFIEPILMKPHKHNHEAAVVCSKGDMRIRVINKNKNWEEALDYCKEHHTSLLWMKDKKDQQAVEQWLNYTDINGTFWIGLRQSVLFGFWIWKDRPVSVSNWKDDKPPELPFSHQCGVLKTTDNYTWSDENCFHEHRFICEEKILKMNV